MQITAFADDVLNDFTGRAFTHNDIKRKELEACCLHSMQVQIGSVQFVDWKTNLFFIFFICMFGNSL